MSEFVRELVEVRLIHPWEVNPRGSELRGMEEFTAQLGREGIREDLHVWRDPQGLLRIMQGHRRHAAALALGLPAVWCKVWDFAEDREAFKHLLTMQMGADPFDARELALATRTAVGMGIDKEDLVGVMHRSEERVQLYLDLGTLPELTQRAVYDGRLALETAAMIRGLGDSERQREATQMVLHDAVSGEPMSAAQSKRVIEEQFLKPERWRKKWEGMLPGLKRKHKVVDGFQYVAFEDRHEYVQAEVGMPQGGYVLAEDFIEDSMLVDASEPMTWGDLAVAHGATLFVCPAPNHVDGYVILVLRKMVMDAEEAKDAGWKLRVKGWRESGHGTPGMASVLEGTAGMPSLLDGGDGPSLAEASAGDEDDDEDNNEDGLARVWAVVDVLSSRTEGAMQDKAWKPLVSVASGLVHDRLPREVWGQMNGAMARDAVKRKGLRWCLALLYAVAVFEEDAEVVRDVERALGIEGEADGTPGTASLLEKGGEA